MTGAVGQALLGDVGLLRSLYGIALLDKSLQLFFEFLLSD